MVENWLSAGGESLSDTIMNTTGELKDSGEEYYDVIVDDTTLGKSTPGAGQRTASRGAVRGRAFQRI